MKTTVDIPSAHLENLMKAGRFRTRTEAINTAVEAYVRRDKIARLLQAEGTEESFMTRKDLDRHRDDGK